MMIKIKMSDTAQIPIQNKKPVDKNYIIDTLYLYSRDVTELLIGNKDKLDNLENEDNLCINALKYIFTNAKNIGFIDESTESHQDDLNALSNDFHNTIAIIFNVYQKLPNDSDIYQIIQHLNWVRDDNTSTSTNTYIFAKLNSHLGKKWDKTPADLQNEITKQIMDLIRDELSTKKVSQTTLKGGGGGYIPPHLRGKTNPEKKTEDERRKEEEQKKQDEERLAEERQEEERKKQEDEERTEAERLIHEEEQFKIVLKQHRDKKIADKIAETIRTTKWVIQQIKYTFSYVIFLFSVSMALNWNFNYIIVNTENHKYKMNLQRRNGMLILFLSIYIAYFKPILDDIYKRKETIQELSQELRQELNDEYNKIITFINQIVYFHNSCINLDTTVSSDTTLSTATTYDIHFNMSKQKSKDINKTKHIKNADKSYDLLEQYNNSYNTKNKTNPAEFNSHELNKEKLQERLGPFSANSLDFDILRSSSPQNKHKLLLPTLPPSAAWEPSVGKSHGLTQIELGDILTKLDLKMCVSDLGLFRNETTQFKVTGIPNIIADSIKNYLWRYNIANQQFSQQYYEEIDYNFSITDYLKSILFYHKKNISKFYILTSIDNHYSTISHTKIGSFGFHVNKDAIQRVIINCEKTANRIAILTGFSAPDKSSGLTQSLINIQSEHRVMVIFDMRKVLDGKIYYFEPFGNYYPVYDIYGRAVPYMQELVVSQELYGIFSKIYNILNSTIPWKVMLPLYDSDKQIRYCNTAIFNVSNAKMYGLEPYEYTQINNLINTTELFGEKTYDWIIGYCGLITLFMTVLVRLNCIPTLSKSYNQNSNGNVDDIYLWFNEFNTNPLYTFDNLLSKFLIRGFINLIDGIKTGQIKSITPKIYDLHELEDKFKSTKVYNLKRTLKLKNKSPNTQTTEIKFDDNDMVSILFRVAGINIKELEKHQSDKELTATRNKLNTIVSYIYRELFHDDNIRNLGLELDNELKQKLDAKYSYIHKQKIERAKRKQLETIGIQNNTQKKSSENIDTQIERKFAPYNTKKILKTWASKLFTNKGTIPFYSEAIRDIFITDGTKFNPNPHTPRVLFIDTA